MFVYVWINQTNNCTVNDKSVSIFKVLSYIYTVKYSSSSYKGKIKVYLELYYSLVMQI